MGNAYATPDNTQRRVHRATKVAPELLSYTPPQ